MTDTNKPGDVDSIDEDFTRIQSASLLGIVESVTSIRDEWLRRARIWREESERQYLHGTIGAANTARKNAEILEACAEPITRALANGEDP